jgi:hypothetical protein
VFLVAADNLSGPLSSGLTGQNRPIIRPETYPHRSINATPRSPTSTTAQAIWGCSHGGTR